ncbi:hypothetical protein IFR05_015145 [Cadophora sp. M221]|nr:hypothetical protein IFR05_015145 [Cadophora sp. M221]
MSNQHSRYPLNGPRDYSDEDLEQVGFRSGGFSRPSPVEYNGYQQAEEYDEDQEDLVEGDSGNFLSSSGYGHLGIPPAFPDLGSTSNEPNNEVEDSGDDLVAEWIDSEPENGDFEARDQEGGEEHDAESLGNGRSPPVASPEASTHPSSPSPLPAPPPPSQPISLLSSSSFSSSSSDSEPARPAKRVKRAPVSTPRPTTRARAGTKRAPASASAPKPYTKPRRKQCPHCPKSYLSLNRHVDSVHKKIRKNKCDFCHRGFSDRSKRDSHQNGRVCLRSVKGRKGKVVEEEEGGEEEESESESHGGFGGYGGYGGDKFDGDNDGEMGGGGNMGEGEGVRQLVAV